MTIAFISIMSAIMIAYDIWVGLKHGASQTISWQMYTFGQAYPIVPFALGILFGHLFWVQHGA